MLEVGEKTDKNLISKVEIYNLVLFISRYFKSSFVHQTADVFLVMQGLSSVRSSIHTKCVSVEGVV